MISPQTQHRNPEHMYFKIPNTTYMICGENFESSWVKVSLKTKKYKCIIQSTLNITAQQCISPEVTVEGFKKCCMSKAVGEIDDDMG